MATRNQNEYPREYTLSAEGQLGLRVDDRPEFPCNPRPNRGRVAPPSQSELNRGWELFGHQETFPSLGNVIVKAIREEQDARFFGQTAPAEVVELPAATADDTVIEFPPRTEAAA